MTKAEKKKWRAKWIDRLIKAGVPLRDLAGKSDHEIWQQKNKHFGSGQMQEHGRLHLPRKLMMR